jgi:hypothetical protein
MARRDLVLQALVDFADGPVCNSQELVLPVMRCLTAIGWKEDLTRFPPLERLPENIPAKCGICHRLIHTLGNQRHACGHCRVVEIRRIGYGPDTHLSIDTWSNNAFPPRFKVRPRPWDGLVPGGMPIWLSIFPEGTAILHNLRADTRLTDPRSEMPRQVKQAYYMSLRDRTRPEQAWLERKLLRWLSRQTARSTFDLQDHQLLAS